MADTAAPAAANAEPSASPAAEPKPEAQAAPAAPAAAANAAAPADASPQAGGADQAEPRLPVRAYLEKEVVPILMQAMMELNRKRPADPIDFLCTYLQQHKSKQQKTA